MKENHYDQSEFFEAYKNMPRSVEGLQAAGEWHELQKLLPDFTGKRVLDLGCGFGWHCRYAAEHGATEVLGTDLSRNMLEEAKRQTDSPVIRYRQCAMEDLELPDSSFDVVISSLAFHYVPDFALMCRRIYAWLTKGGHLVFSVEHPVFTAEGSQNWHRSEDGEILHWPVDRYFDEGQRTANFLGQRVTKYHKTLTTYLNSLIRAGFTITGIVEPQPAEHLLDSVPGMRDELRRPMMLLVSAIK